jgi:hypothetical protein
MTKPHPTFNHVAMSVAPDLLDAAGREEILAFHADVFGWTEMPTLTLDRERLVLRAYNHEQFVFLTAGGGAEQAMRAGPMDHFGMSVETVEELEEMRERARKRRAADPRVEIHESDVEDFGFLKLHSFYVRFLLPLHVEVQCFAWADGIDPTRAPEAG